MMAILPAQPHDLEEVRLLLSGTSLPTAGIEEHFHSFLVARGDDGRLAGVIGLEAYGDAGLLRSLAVDDDYRSRGLGKELVERLFALARARRVATMYLLTTTAERYFPRFGFVTIAREQAPESLQGSEELRGACPASAVLMRRSL